jgi:hypothetical protein
MQKTTINGQDIDAVTIAADGTEAADGLQPSERDLLAKIDAALKADAGFAKACPDARLIRIDSNRGFTDRDAGRFYLRYQHKGKGGMAEFWGNAADTTTVDMKGGIVCVAE